ncbi:MAG: IS21 family transposase, partial [Deltaproteobacteria bacterium]|nr:IS21 family transposase [Deltaproteobacteria bacterium]
KGRVERNIRFVRSAFMTGRDINTPLDELNADARAWCLGPALERPWPEDDGITVGDAFARERKLLMPLPDVPFPTDAVCPVRIGKTPYARFDGNDYSVPPGHVGATLTVLASPERIRILDGESEVAVHNRSWDRKARVEDPAHVKALIAGKRHGRTMGMRDRLIRAVPRAQDLLAAAGARNDNVAMIAQTLTRRLDRHGADELDRAIGLALERGSPHSNTVIRILETGHGARQRLPVELGTDAGLTTPRSTGLDAYDRATTKGTPE